MSCSENDESQTGRDRSEVTFRGKNVGRPATYGSGYLMFIAVRLNTLSYALRCPILALRGV